jgi:NTE family protein
MFEAIMGTFHIMEMAMMESKMKVFKPDIYVKPDLNNYQIMDFHRKDEILSSVTGDVEKFKRQLSKKLKERKFRIF